MRELSDAKVPARKHIHPVIPHPLEVIMKALRSLTLCALFVGLTACGTPSVQQSLSGDLAEPTEPQAQPGLYLDQARDATPEEIQMVKAIWSMSPEATSAMLDKLDSAAPDAQLGLLKQSIASQQQLNALGSYPGGLTWAEFKLCAAHPIKCSKTKGYADDALAEAKRQFSDGLYLGRGDAFRHGYWNALMASYIDYSWAVDFATAHESETPNGNDKSMDLWNNREGRLSSGTSSTSRSTLISRIRTKILSGSSTKCLRGEVKSGALIYTNSRSCKVR